MNESAEPIPEKVEFTPIGYVENDYLEPGHNEEIYGKVSKIILRKDLEDGLYRVDELEKLFHRRHYDGEMSGVFASRSPFRPNGIGLTIVEFLKVEGNVLYVKGLDAINGTPVLDIKPYIKKLEEKTEESKD
jgi:tRNA (adenine37-N6)-methyltransferase